MNSKIEINLFERGTGKTSKIRDLILNDESESVGLFQFRHTITYNQLKEAKCKNIKLFFRFSDFTGCNFDTLYIDDYLLFINDSTIKTFYNQVFLTNKIKNIVIYTSIYNKFDFLEFCNVSSYKENKTELDSLYKNSSLLHNLITEPNVVINNNYPFSIFK
jgi:hypothetical protein